MLRIPVEAFQNFDEEQAINITSNTVTNNDNAVMHSLFSNYPTFNPIDKIVQLYDEKVVLYERMLKEKDEMMARLEKQVEKK